MLLYDIGSTLNSALNEIFNAFFFVRILTPAPRSGKINESVPERTGFTARFFLRTRRRNEHLVGIDDGNAATGKHSWFYLTN
jgi:hypothetical protein